MTTEQILTARQQEIVALANEGKTIAQIARATRTTTGAISAQMTRIRKAGIDLPSAAARRNGTPSTPLKQESESASRPTSVTEYAQAELAATNDRLSAIVTEQERLAGEHEAAQERLADEQQALREQADRLEAAVRALEGNLPVGAALDRKNAQLNRENHPRAGVAAEGEPDAAASVEG